MSRRGVPQIVPRALRDQATPDRVERVWARIDADLPSQEGGAPSTTRFTLGMVAATAASLICGVLLGKVIYDQPTSTTVESVQPAASSETAPSRELFAAGSTGRQFDLPGGGRLELQPGATVEVLREGGHTLELRLVQGEATVDTQGGPEGRTVAVVAGEAILSTPAGGTVRVRRNMHDLDVTADRGSVDIHSPSGSQVLRDGEHVSAVPIRRTAPTARVRPVMPRGSARPAVVEEPPSRPVVVVAPSVADWRVKSAEGELEEALRLLRAQPGGLQGAVAAAKDAPELWEVHDVAARHDTGAAVMALTRVVNQFPDDASAQLAAYKLGEYYRRMGQPDRAREWFARAEGFGGVLSEDALCKQFRTATNKEEALRFAQEYVAKYPHGRCTEEAERIISGDTPDDEPEQAPSAEEGEPDAAAP